MGKIVKNLSKNITWIVLIKFFILYIYARESLPVIVEAVH